jgi:hypothetical protein
MEPALLGDGVIADREGPTVVSMVEAQCWYDRVPAVEVH